MAWTNQREAAKRAWIGMIVKELACAPVGNIAGLAGSDGEDKGAGEEDGEDGEQSDARPPYGRRSRTFRFHIRNISRAIHEPAASG